MITPHISSRRAIAALFAAVFLLSLGTVSQGAAQSAPPTVVVIVRHAEKAAEPRNDPPLTEVGSERATALAEMLRDADVAVVMHTPTARTRDTALPVARQFGLTPEILPLGPMSSHANAVAEAVRKYPGKTIVVVGHSNTIMGYLAALGGPQRGELCDHQYNGLYTLVFDGPSRQDGPSPRLIEGRYGPPNPPMAEPCTPD